MDTTERLAAIEAIKQLKARYFRSVDTKDWGGLERVFAPDFTVLVPEAPPDGSFAPPETGAVQGASTFVAFVRDVIGDAVSVHQGFSPEIEITSETTATGIWSMEDVLRWPEDSSSALRSLHGYGHYHETYVLRDDAWQIQTMRHTRLLRDVEPRS